MSNFSVFLCFPLYIFLDCLSSSLISPLMLLNDLSFFAISSISLFTFLFLYISPLFLSSSHISLSLKSLLYTCLSYFSYISIFLSYFASQSLLSPLLLHLLSYIFFLLCLISFSDISSFYLISHLVLLYPFTLEE